MTCAGYSFAGEGMPCRPIEYAKLKDASRAELKSEYCSASAKQDLNSGLADAQMDLYKTQTSTGSATAATQRSIQELNDAKASCARAAADVAGMLKKKYGVSKPDCKS
jgi:hypothetical protein